MAARGLRRSSYTIRVGVLSFVLALLSSEVEGQTFPLEPVDRTTFALQWEKPFFPNAGGLAGWSSNLEGDILFSLSSGRSIQVGVPLAFAGADVVDGTSFYLGNLRASLLFGDADDLSGFVGVTVPTASNIGGPDLAAIVGGLPWLDEIEKWSDDAISLRGAWIPSRALDGGGLLGLRLGGAAVTPNEFDNLLVFARVAGWGRFPVGTAEVRADLTTSYYVNGDDGFGEQFVAYLNLGAALPESSGHPGLFIRIPLDGDARDALDLSIGLSARF